MFNYYFILFSLCFLFSGCGWNSHTLITESAVSENFISDKNIKGDRAGRLAQSRTTKHVDILFILDTSYSMVSYLEKAHQSFKGFIPRLSSVYWRIAFTNADHVHNTSAYYNANLFEGRIMRLEKGGELLPYRFLHPFFADKEKIFLDTVKRYEEGDISPEVFSGYINPCDLPPYCQSSNRSPIQSLVSSFTEDKNWLRRRADFVAVIFTNGDDLHFSTLFAQRVVNLFRKTHGKEKKFIIYSISITPEDSKCFEHHKNSQYRFAVFDYSKKIQSLVRFTRGKSISICEPNYSHLAEMIVNAL